MCGKWGGRGGGGKGGGVGVQSGGMFDMCTSYMSTKQTQFQLNVPHCTNLQVGAITVGHKPESPAHHFTLLWVKVLCEKR